MGNNPFDQLIERGVVERHQLGEADRVDPSIARSATARLMAIGVPSAPLLKALSELTNTPLATQAQLDAKIAPPQLAPIYQKAMKRLVAAPIGRNEDGVLEVVVADPRVSSNLTALGLAHRAFLAHELDVTCALAKAFPDLGPDDGSDPTLDSVVIPRPVSLPADPPRPIAMAPPPVTGLRDVAAPPTAPPIIAPMHAAAPAPIGLPTAPPAGAPALVLVVGDAPSPPAEPVVVVDTSPPVVTDVPLDDLAPPPAAAAELADLPPVADASLDLPPRASTETMRVVRDRHAALPRPRRALLAGALLVVALVLAFVLTRSRAPEPEAPVEPLLPLPVVDAGPSPAAVDAGTTPVKKKPTPQRPRKKKPHKKTKHR